MYATKCVAYSLQNSCDMFCRAARLALHLRITEVSVVTTPVLSKVGYDSHQFGRPHLFTAIDIGSSRISAAAVLIGPSGLHEPFWQSDLFRLPDAAQEDSDLIV